MKQLPALAGWVPASEQAGRQYFELQGRVERRGPFF
jgi:hypothetical protein